MSVHVVEDLIHDSVLLLDAGHAEDDDAERREFFDGLAGFTPLRLREIVRRTGAMSVPLPDGYRPSDDELAVLDDECASWWYRV